MENHEIHVPDNNDTKTELHHAERSKVSKPVILKSLLTSVVAFAAITFGTAATFALYGTHGGVFQHHNARLVDRLAASSTGIRVTITEKKPNGVSTPESGNTWRPGTVYHGVLYPNVDGDSQSADKTFDGRLSYVHHGNEFNFTMLHNRGFMTVADEQTGKLELSRCMTTSDIPSLPFSLPLSVKSLAHVLMSARVVDDVGSQVDVECDVSSGDRLVEVLVSGEPFVFCSEAKKSVESEKVLMLHGLDIQIEVSFLSEQRDEIGLLPPVVSSSDVSRFVTQVDADKCEPIKSDAEVTSESLTKGVHGWLSSAMQRADDAMRVVVRGEARRALMAESDSCTCASKKVCLFVHGFGRSAGSVTTSDTSYWGSIHTDATCCSSTKFIHLDTTNYAWYDDTLTSQFCSTALSVSGGSNAQSIANVAVVAHSMGNLIVASALQKGTCALASTSKWIALSPPMYGSNTSSKLIALWSSLSSTIQTAICNDNESALSSTLHKAFANLGLCGTRASVTSLAYSGSSQSTATLVSKMAAARTVFASKVSNVMCGINSYGITSTDSAKMVLVDTFSAHASSDNDGVVEYTSCRGGLSSGLFDGDWDDGGGYYRANINHRDATFRNGNAVLGDSRKPVKWFNCQFN